MRNKKARLAECPQVIARHKTFYQRKGKRVFDTVVVILATPLLIPIISLVALSVLLFLGRPILFRQVRVGEGGSLFRMIKFRSMLDTRDENGNLLSDEERLSTIGNLLRSTSLDELPEIWNVIRGQMSLVGPRPLLPQYLDLYTPTQARRHKVLPGITGMAQVNGRNAASWEDRFIRDVQYVDNQSLALDVRILLKTIWTVVHRQGVSAQDHATMPPFQGTTSNQEKNAA